MRRLAPFLISALCACSSAPTPEKDPELEDRFVLQNARNQSLREDRDRIERVMIDLDTLLDRYTRASFNSGPANNADLADRLDRAIRELVEEHYDSLLALADGTVQYEIRPDQAEVVSASQEIADQMSEIASKNQRNRMIALAALGFSEQDVLGTLLNGVDDPDPVVASNAVFGLAVRADSRTPPGILEALIRSDRLDQASRANAAWALYRVQLRSQDVGPILAIWARLLAESEDPPPPGVLISALRGTGRAKVQDAVPAIVSYVGHPTPLVRQAAAIALGRIGDERAVEPLLGMIGPTEDNQNVRLSARKALQALAGGTDLGYDVEEWRKAFQRG